MRDEEFWRNYFYRVHMVRSSFPVEDVDEDEDAGEAGDGAGEGDRHSHGGTESGRAPEARVELPAWHGGGERGGEGQRKGPSPPSGEEDSFVRVARPAERPSAGRGAREGEEAEEEGEDEEEDLALAFASDEVEAEMEGQTASTAHTVPEHALLHMRGQLGLGGSGGAGKADTGEKGDGDDAATGAAEDRGDGVGEGDGVEEDLELDWELEGLDDYGGADEGEVDEDGACAPHRSPRALLPRRLMRSDDRAAQSTQSWRRRSARNWESRRVGAAKPGRDGAAPGTATC